MDKERFLAEYKIRARDPWSDVDVALICLLEAFDDDIDYLYQQPHYFHKAFRQVDVVYYANGKIDSAIYNLLSASKLFWIVFDEFIEIEDK